MAAQRREIWDGVLEQPWAERLEKPRTAGLTMVIDKGIGLSQTRDLLQMAAAHIDFLKLGFGTSLIYPSEALTRKISLAKEYGVHVYPGGTLLELAVHQGRSAAFLERARELGFTCIEVSEGTIDLPPAKRRELIARGVELGFCVLTEIGKKARGSRPDPAAVRARLLDDLAQGAAYVIIEGRDGGRDVGVYDPAGGMDQRLVDAILAQISAPSRIIWEAPRIEQQQAWLLKLGPNVNLGNVQPEDVISLESTRRGLRGDTLRACLNRSSPPQAEREEVAPSDTGRDVSQVGGGIPRFVS